MFLYVAVILNLWPVVLLAPLNLQPNIVFILADDLGWNDVSFNGSPDINTPHLDELAAAGVILKNYYVQPACTPSRAALLSGTYPITNGLCHDVIHTGQRLALPLELPTIADKLKGLGYATHMIGKWHVGHHEISYLPTHRGFDTYLGCLQGFTDHYDHRIFERFRNSAGTATTFDGHDFLEGDSPVYEYDGQHDTDIYTARFEKLLKSHMETTPNKPFFFDVSYTAPHFPLQAPQKFVQQYMSYKDENRRDYAALISHMDEGVGNITKAIKSYSGLWENTIVIFSTDNGGSDNFGGNNYPLRGNKGTLLQGGVRGVGFVSGGLIDTAYRNTTSNAFMHIADWYPTLVSLAGGNVASQTLDGLDVWSSINGNATSPRRELLLNIDNHPAAARRGDQRPDSPFDVRLPAGIIVDNWKLVTGHGINLVGNTLGVVSRLDSWFNTPNSFENVTIQSRIGGFEIAIGAGQYIPGYIERLSVENATKNVWLFDIAVDPNEYTDLSDANPQQVNLMLERLAYYMNVTQAGGCRFLPNDLLADPCWHQGNFVPWVNNDQPPPVY